MYYFNFNFKTKFYNKYNDTNEQMVLKWVKTRNLDCDVRCFGLRVTKLHDIVFTWQINYSIGYVDEVHTIQQIKNNVWLLKTCMIILQSFFNHFAVCKSCLMRFCICVWICEAKKILCLDCRMLSFVIHTGHTVATALSTKTKTLRKVLPTDLRHTYQSNFKF